VIEDQNKLREVPKGWAIVSLKEVAEILPGYGFPERYQGKTEGAIPFFKVKDISTAFLNGSIFLKKAENYVSFNECNELNAKPLKENTIVFAKIGEAIGLNRRAILAQVSLVDNNVMGVSVFPEVLYNLYAFYFFLTIRLEDYSRATTVPSVRKSDVEQIQIPLPPLAEQHRIASKVEELFTNLDAGVESLKKVKTQLKRYRQAVLKYAFEGKLTEEWRKTHKDQIEPAQVLLERIKEEHEKNSKGKFEELFPEDTSDLPELPSDWIWIGFSAVCNKIQDGSHFSPKTQYKTGGEGKYLYLTAKNLKEGGIDLSDVTYVDHSYHKSIYRRCNPEKDDVLLIKDGVKTGIATINNLEEEFSLLSSVALFKPKKNIINPYYLKHFLNSPIGFSLTTGKMTGTAIKRIILDKIRKSFIPLAPFVEQHRIVEEIESRLSITDEIEKVVAQGTKQAERLRQSILKKAFDSKLVPQDLSDEPAEKLLQRIKEERARSKGEKDTNKKKNKPRQLEVSTYVE
jgi:type I restriction enzyme S subunit